MNVNVDRASSTARSPARFDQVHSPTNYHRLPTIVAFVHVVSTLPAVQVAALVENQEPYFSLLCQALDLFSS